MREKQREVPTGTAVGLARSLATKANGSHGGDSTSDPPVRAARIAYPVSDTATTVIAGSGQPVVHPALPSSTTPAVSPRSHKETSRPVAAPIDDETTTPETVPPSVPQYIPDLSVPLTLIAPAVADGAASYPASIQSHSHPASTHVVPDHDTSAGSVQTAIVDTKSTPDMVDHSVSSALVGAFAGDSGKPVSAPSPNDVSEQNTPAAAVSALAAPLPQTVTLVASHVATISPAPNAQPVKPATAVATSVLSTSPGIVPTLVPNVVPGELTGPVATTNPPPVAISQVAPALVSLATRNDGGNELSISLHPHDLGQVGIRMTRLPDGSTTVTVTASQLATLQELSQNAHHLHAALDAANIPAEHRVIVFEVAALASSDPNQNQGTTGSNDGQFLPERNNAASTGQSSDPGSGQGRPSLQGRYAQAPGQRTGGAAVHPSSPMIVSTRRWNFSGLNITA